MGTPFDEDWVSQADIDALNLESSVYTDETNEQTARRLIEEAAPDAARTLCNLVRSPSVSERMRYQASTYILDRVLGRAGDLGTTGRAPWEAVYDAVLSAMPEEAQAS